VDARISGEASELNAHHSAGARATAVLLKRVGAIGRTIEPEKARRLGLELVNEQEKVPRYRPIACLCSKSDSFFID
jgi:hypothetical protein